MKPPRVLLFIESGGPGGAESVVLNLAKGLIKKGVPTAVATIRTGWLTEQLSKHGITRVPIVSRSGLDPLLTLRIAIAARKFGATVIHSHLLDSNFYASIAAKLAGINCVATEHGDAHHSIQRRFVAHKLKAINLLATHFVAVSNYTASRCSDAAMIPSPEVVPNPLPEPQLHSPQAIAELRAHERFATNDFVWINVANLRPVKDQQTLIKAFSLSLKSNPQQRLVILGEGEKRGELLSHIAELQLADRVRLMGLVDNVDTWLQAGDGVVLTSLSEAMPMSLLEAMSYRRPIVATAVGGIPELVTDGVNGYLAKPGNIEEIAQKLVQLTSNIDQAKIFGDNGYEFAKQYFTPAVVDRYLTLYSR